jgi:hypothetical protein
MMPSNLSTLAVVDMMDGLCSSAGLRFIFESWRVGCDLIDETLGRRKAGRKDRCWAASVK